jgi:hypothetical protein
VRLNTVDEPGFPRSPWYFKGDHPLVDEDHADVHGAPFRVSAASADYVRGMWSRQKVLLVGRHQFDLTNGSEGHLRAALKGAQWVACRRRAASSVAGRPA